MTLGGAGWQASHKAFKCFTVFMSDQDDDLCQDPVSSLEFIKCLPFHISFARSIYVQKALNS